jgi:hypothetical protein
MPELREIFQNTAAFNDAAYESAFIYIADVNSIKFTVYCDQNCDYGWRWAVDNYFEVIDTDTYSLVGGTTQDQLKPITSRYVQFYVNNFGSLPVDLKTQGFFFDKMIGFDGATGPQGDTGPQGIPGTASNTGATGDTGPTGSQGDTGATGIIGDTGPTGFTGAQGIPGTASNTGATGTTGATGQIGATGPGVSSSVYGEMSATGGSYTLIMGGPYAQNNSAFLQGSLSSVSFTSGPPSFLTIDESGIYQVSTVFVFYMTNSGRNILFQHFVNGVGVGETVLTISCQAIADSKTMSSVFLLDLNVNDTLEIRISVDNNDTTLNINNASMVIQKLIGGLGDTGPMGDTGLMGDTGPIGDTGLMGDTGPIGSTGPPGVITTLTDVGVGTGTLTVDGVGPSLTVKSLVQGSGVTLTNNANDVTIALALGTDPYVETTGVIKPVSASVNAISSGTLNILQTVVDNSLIAGCNGCSLVGSRTDYSAIVGSLGCEVRTSGSAGDGKNCFIGGSNLCTIGGNTGGVGTNAGIGESFISSKDCYYDGRGTYTSIIASNNSIGHDVNESCIIGCNACELIDSRVTNSGIACSTNCQIRTGFGAGDGKHCFIAASSGCAMGTTVLGSGSNAGIGQVILGCVNTFIDNRSDYNGIIAGDSHLILGSNSNRSVIIGGRNGTISHNDTFMFTAGATTLNSSSSEQFNVKAPGGSRIYSNDGASTGVTLAGGGGSWTTVSDINAKTNVIECNYSDILTKLSTLKICKYNYKGNVEQQRCLGPSSQDFHAIFPFFSEEYPVMDEETGDQLLDEDDNPVFKESKTRLGIEVCDLLGIALASIKCLNSKVKSLEAKIEALEGI